MDNVSTDYRGRFSEKANIVLVGMPLSGKSSLGRALAERLCRPFYDTDAFIESRASAPVEEIFAASGEEHFRVLEGQCVEDLAGVSGSVIATGGGTILNSSLAAILKKNGILIWLDTELDILCGRSGGTRPLLAGNRDERFRNLYDERRPFYLSRSDYRVANNGDFAAALDDLERLAREILLPAKINLALVGEPVCHSLSPLIHRELARISGINAGYIAHAVSAAELEDWTQSARGFINGFNITMPHKKQIRSYLDYCHEDAERISSVNTVVNKNGFLSGYSTDGGGFLLQLASMGIKPKGLAAVILGGGGAARAITQALINEGAPVTVLSADAHEREALKTLFKTAEVLPFDLERLKTFPRGLLVNATPLGMRGCEGWQDLSFAGDNWLAVIDLVYLPRETALLNTSRMAGINSANGLPMLVYQAILSFELFTGITFDREVAYARVKSGLDILC